MQELLTSQGVPVYEETNRYAGAVGDGGEAFQLLDMEGIPESAMRRMAGNTFNLPCATTFIVYCLAMLKQRPRDANGTVQLAPARDVVQVSQCSDSEPEPVEAE